MSNLFLSLLTYGIHVRAKGVICSWKRVNTVTILLFGSQKMSDSHEKPIFVLTIGDSGGPLVIKDSPGCHTGVIVGISRWYKMWQHCNDCTMYIGFNNANHLPLVCTAKLNILHKYRKHYTVNLHANGLSLLE